MSNSTNHELRSWKVSEDRLRSVIFKYQGKPLSKGDNATYSTAIFLQGLILEDLLVDDSPSLRREVLRWYKTMESLDVYDVASATKILITLFRNYTGQWEDNYDGFKHHLMAEIPFIGAFLAPIRGDVVSFINTMSSSSFRIINQFLSTITKISLRDVDRRQQSLEDYLKIETELADIKHYPPLITALNCIMREWLQDFDWDSFLPGHGPGAVALMGRASLRDKYENLGSDAMLSYFLSKDIGDSIGFFPLDSHGFDRMCEVVFVPKSILTWRTISMEPATLQYFQQGVWRSLDRYMCSHPHLKHHVSVHDQTVNRRLAQIASADNGSYATIDLSCASDTVSWDLVKGIFAGTKLLRSCYATRSRFAILPNQEIIPLRKFAPMGSALCFPIECLVFAVVCEYVTRGSRRTSARDAYSVYGDDIVVRHEYAQDTVGVLEMLGFRVNTQKSFISRFIPFRESCGGEYYYGVDVTPFRLSRKFSCDEIDDRHPSVLQAYVDGANLAKSHCLKLTRLWFVHKLINLPRRIRPLFTEDDVGVRSDNPTNFHLNSVFSKDWQCHLWLHGTIGSKPLAQIPKDSDETVRLFEWLRSCSYRHRPTIWPGDAVEANISRSRSLIQTSRTPKNTLEIPS